MQSSIPISRKPFAKDVYSISLSEFVKESSGTIDDEVAQEANFIFKHVQYISGLQFEDGNWEGQETDDEDSDLEADEDEYHHNVRPEKADVAAWVSHLR